MGQEAHVRHGLGLSRRGHAILVGFYVAFLTSFAAFGLGEIWDQTGQFRDRWTAHERYVSAVSATRAAFRHAIDVNARRPSPNPMIPHRILFYPIIALRQQQEGTVTLDVLVLPNGQVGDVKIKQSSGYPQLDATALLSVGGWYYVPAVKNHKAVSARIAVKIRFRMRQ